MSLATQSDTNWEQEAIQVGTLRTPHASPITGEMVRAAFPFPEFRTYQAEALDQICRLLNDRGKRFVMLQAPVGFGKSPVAIALARAYQGAHLITTQKILQSQYQRDFADHLVDLRGRGSYPCHRNSDKTACSDGPCVVTRIPCKRVTSGIRREVPATSKGVVCDYYSILEKAAVGPITLTNYAALLAHGAYTRLLSPRQILLVDEAHRSEEILMGFVAFSLQRGTLRKHLPSLGEIELPEPKDAEELLRWAQNVLLPAAETTLDQAREGMRTHGWTDADAGISRALVRQVTYLDSLVRKIIGLAASHHSGERWVVDTSGLPNTLVGKPLMVARYGRQIFNFGEKVVLMSGTILNPDVMARSLGIPPGSYGYVEVASTFPVENRPLRREFVGSMTRRNLQTTMPKLLDKVAELAQRHAYEKGVIHTHTFEIARQVLGRLGARAMGHTSENREQVLQQFIQDPGPRILVSPSMTDGLDLPEDLGRWQVLAKTPYPYLGDPQVAARAELDPDWYAWRTCVSIVQATGRIVRSKTDRGVTYFTDSTTQSVVENNISILPNYFLDAWERG